MPDSTGNVSRRRLLATTASTATALLAGCGGDGGGGAATPGGTDTTTGSAESTSSPTETATPVPITRLVAEAATHLEGTEPTLPTAPLRGAVTSIEDATVVGLGESVYGTKELFDLNHRLVRHLVADRGARSIGLAVNFGVTPRIERYVTGGDVDVKLALRRVTNPAFRREEVATLLKWLREYNATAGDGSMVTVFGFGVRGHLAAAVALAEYFARVDESFARANREAISTLINTDIRVDDGQTRSERMQTMRDALSTVRSRLRDRETVYVSRSSRGAYERAVRLAWVIERDVEQVKARYANGKRPRAVRQRAMAANVEWMRNRTDGEAMALLGHSRNLAKRSGSNSAVRPMGRRLANAIDGSVATVTATATEGTFSALSPDASRLRGYSLGTPPSGSIPATFGAVEETPFVLDFARTDGRLRKWLAATHRGHEVAQVYDPDAPSDQYASITLASGFDAAIHAGTVTAATNLQRESE